MIRAETLFTSFLVEHNCSISAADHAGKLFREMFPGNPVAKDYKCTYVCMVCVCACV